MQAIVDAQLLETMLKERIPLEDWICLNHIPLNPGLFPELEHRHFMKPEVVIYVRNNPTRFSVINERVYNTLSAENKNFCDFVYVKCRQLLFPLSDLLLGLPFNFVTECDRLNYITTIDEAEDNLMDFLHEARFPDGNHYNAFHLQTFMVRDAFRLLKRAIDGLFDRPSYLNRYELRSSRKHLTSYRDLPDNVLNLMRFFSLM